MEMTLSEFYVKYWKVDGNAPSFRDIDKEYFDIFDKAYKEGKQLIHLKARPKNYDAYIYSLSRTGLELINGKTVLVWSQKPQKTISDLKLYFGIEVTQEDVHVKGKKQDNAVNIKLK